MTQPWFLPAYHYRAWYRRLFFWLVDRAGSGVNRFTGKKQALLTPSAVRRILVIRNDALGDWVMTLPALQALKRSFPLARLDLLVSRDAAPLARLLPEVHEVYESQASWFSGAFIGRKIQEAENLIRRFRKNQYDLGVDFRGDLRNIVMMARAGIPHRIGYGVTGGGFLLTHCPPYPKREHQVLVNLALLKCLGITAFPALDPLPEPEGARDRILALFPKLFQENPKPLLVLHSGAGYPAKRWPHENYRALIRSLLERGLAKIVLIGTAREREQFDFSDFDPVSVQDLRGKAALTDLPALFSLADHYVGNDSGPAHLAALSGLEVTILFSGTNNPKYWHPWSTQLSLISYPIACSPCHAKHCPKRHHLCMKGITIEEVFQTLKTHLKSYTVTPRAVHEI